MRGQRLLTLPASSPLLWDRKIELFYRSGMAQRDVIVSLGSIVKRWEQNKRQVSENKGFVLTGNKVEAEDFDVFDQWLGRQRKFLRDYLGSEEYDELKTIRRFLKQETDVPQIQIHFGVWSSLVCPDNKIILERFSRLMNEYHQARVTDIFEERRCPLKEYKNKLGKELTIIKKIQRTKENYHLQIMEMTKLKKKDGFSGFDSDYVSAMRKKQDHKTKMARKTYEDILCYEAGKIRTSLFKASHELEQLILEEEEKRLAQLFAIMEEYIKLLLNSSDLDLSRKAPLRQITKQMVVLIKKIPSMTKAWIQNHRVSVQFPAFQVIDEDEDGETCPHLVRTIRDELYAIDTRTQYDVSNERVICMSSSAESVGNETQTHEVEVFQEALFQATSTCTAKKSSEATDISVEDLEEVSDHVLVPVPSSSARSFKMTNQRRRHSQQLANISSASCGCMDVMPGALVSDEDLVTKPVRRPRQISISSSEEDITAVDNILKVISRNDEVLPFSVNLKERYTEERIAQLTGIYVKAKVSYSRATPGDLQYEEGDVIKQEQACNAEGMAYGYIRKSRFGQRESGYYSIKNMKFHRLGTKFTNPTPPTEKPRQNL